MLNIFQNLFKLEQTGLSLLLILNTLLQHSVKKVYCLVNYEILYERGNMCLVRLCAINYGEKKNSAVQQCSVGFRRKVYVGRSGAPVT